MTQDDRMETIADPELIRAVWEAGGMGEESLGGDSESGTYNRSNRPPAGPRPDADNPWALLPDGHPQRPKQCGGCGTKWVDAETARACERRHGDDIATPAPVGDAVALDLDAAHVRTDPACTFHDGATPKASRGKSCPACMRLDLDALHETICDKFTGMAEVRQAADLLVAEVRRLTRWQSEALPVMVGLQGLGSALGMRLGESITGHAAAEAARALTARAEAAEAEVRRLTEERDRWRSAWQGANRGWAEDQARAEAAEAEVVTLRATLAAVEALVNNGQTVGWIERDGDVAWIAADAIRAALAVTTGRVSATDLCPECDHQHTPEGCTGDPSPSDIWAGVSVSSCDCDDDMEAQR